MPALSLAALRDRKCARCQRPYRGKQNWSFKFHGDVLVEIVCPDCLTPAEHVEAALNRAGFRVTREGDQQ
ncbi:hypothetical protein [Georgenia sp. AZ-5]|uniref:hypothetical protein n=1 Tax=Georgenia sp. AZ-5 TaxID=3367526 RepID=UPI0037541034